MIRIVSLSFTNYTPIVCRTQVIVGLYIWGRRQRFVGLSKAGLALAVPLPPYKHTRKSKTPASYGSKISNTAFTYTTDDVLSSSNRECSILTTINSPYHFLSDLSGSEILLYIYTLFLAFQVQISIVPGPTYRRRSQGAPWSHGNWYEIRCLFYKIWNLDFVRIVSLCK